MGDPMTLLEPTDSAPVPHEADPAPSPNGLTDPEFELVMLHVDGELSDDSVRAAAAVALLEQSAVARAVAADWVSAKVALREAVLDPAHEVDLSRVRGRVMTKLPADVRSAAVDPQPAAGFGAWLRSLGLGKVTLAVGAAVAVAAWLVATAAGPGTGPGGAAPPAVAEVPGEAPAVIIEEIEIEGGSVVVDPGKGPGTSTIIWHFEAQGAG
ncbi:MAG: hypothetical protein EXR79_00180 [Myxococcales bacterium]|nr:hypothetical protein [Myxococcales bacterium]